MIAWHITIFVLVAAAEALIYAWALPGHRIARRSLLILIAVFMLASAGMAVATDPIWAFPVLLFVPYRLINQARAFRGAGSEQRLRVTSLRTLAVTVAIQLAAVCLTWALVRYVTWGHLALVAAALQATVAVWFLAATVRTWRRIKPPVNDTHLTDHQLPTLSVLVPARDETFDLQSCLEHLVASDYPKLEIIALDDCSANRRTPEIIRSFAHDGVRFVQGKEPPARWLAKNHAYKRLAEEASGELLLFCGVDTIVEPHTLRRLVELMLAKKRDMISLLPLRPATEHRKLSFIQAMRYWWELGFPRRTFHRPPVLSTLWLIRADALRQGGGFAAVAQAITPEAYFAKTLIKSDAYAFLRSTPNLPVYSTKGLAEQYSTAIRVRYPQLHRRIEMVALTTLFELFFLLGPFIFLPAAVLVHFGALPIVLWLFAAASISLMYYLIAIRTHLNNLALGILTAPVAFILDIFMLHNSMFKYEFSDITWHDRSISRPMLQVIPRLPEA